MPFKFECGIGTVFSPSKGNVCVYPNDSGRPECCEPSNEIDSNESSSSSNWNQEPQFGYPSQNSSSLNQLSETQQPQYPNYNPQFQKPHYSSYPQQSQKPVYPSLPTQTQKPDPSSYPLQTQSPEPNYTPQTQGSYQPSYPQTMQYPQQPNYPAHSESSESSHCNQSDSTSCGSSAGCTEEGFFPNREDCHKFYRCVNEGSVLKRYDFTCGTATAWDQTIQTCNYENIVDNCGFASESENHSQPSISQSQAPNSGTSFRPSTTQVDQSQSFTLNDSAITSTYMPYPSSQSIQRPTHPSYLPPQSTQYTTQSPYPPSLPIQQSIPSHNGNNEVETSSTGGKPCASTGSPKDCKEEGFFSNSQDCHKFYRCVNENGSFHKYDFECGTGTAWDQQLQTCNHENSITCGTFESGTYPPDFDSASVNQKPSSGTGPQGEKPNSTSGTIKPSTNQSSQSTIQPNFNEAQSTSQFTIISTAQTTMKVTPSSTESISQNTNNSEILNNQQGSTTQLQSTSQIIQSTTQSISQLVTSPPLQQTLDQSQQTTPIIENQSNPSFSTNKPQNSSNCKCEGEGFFANSNDCRKFYRCVNNPPGYIKYDFDCAPGTAWDQSLLTCNYIDQVATCKLGQNEVKPNQTVVSENASTLTSSQISTITQTSIENNHESVQPTTGIKLSTKNPHSTEGSSTGSTYLEITSSSSTESSSVSSIKPDCNTPKPNNTIVCNKIGFYPHPTRCDKFYRCVDNGKGFNVYYFDCPVGTIFDPSIEVCNYRESVYPIRVCETGESQDSTLSQSQSSTTQGISSSITTSNPQNGISTSETSSIIPELSSEVSSTTELNTSSTMEITSGSTISNDEVMTLNSETTSPVFEATTSSFEATSSESQETTSSADLTTASFDTMNTSSEATVSSSEETTSSSEMMTSDSEITSSSDEMTLSSEALTPSSELTTTSSELMTSSFEGSTMNSEVTTSGYEATGTSFEMTTSGSEITTSNSESTVQMGESTTTALSSTEKTTESSDTTTATDSISSSQQQPTSTIQVQETTTVSLSTIDSQESTTINSSGKPSDSDYCPVPANLTDDQVVLVCPTGFRRHPKLCNLFYQCTMSANTEIKILILQCPEGTVFDEKMNKCMPEFEGSASCKGTVTGKRIQRGVSNKLIPIVS
jgi:collagen type IV alpha